jgi:hypothetical protein
LSNFLTLLSGSFYQNERSSIKLCEDYCEHFFEVCKDIPFDEQRNDGLSAFYLNDKASIHFIRFISIDFFVFCFCFLHTLFFEVRKDIPFDEQRNDGLSAFYLNDKASIHFIRFIFYCFKITFVLF